MTPVTALRTWRWRLAAPAFAVLLGACTTTPTTEEMDQQGRASAELGVSLLRESAPPSVVAEIDIHEAMAIGLRHNLDFRVSQFEQAAAQKDVSKAYYRLLPQFNVNGTAHWRNNRAGSYSESLATGLVSLEPSSSQERRYRTADLDIQWSVLDFSVGYFQARQRKLDYLATIESRRATANKVARDIHAAYWRAYGAQQLAPVIEDGIKQINEAIEVSATLVDKQLQDPAVALEYRRALYANLRDLVSKRSELRKSRAELAALLNLPAGRLPILKGDFRHPLDADQLGDLRTRAVTALTLRPEMREEYYRIKRLQYDRKTAWFSGAPDLRLQAGANFDSNKYLTESNWKDARAILTLNLSNLIELPANLRYINASLKSQETRLAAMTASVLAQTLIATESFAESRSQACLSRELQRIEEARLKQLQARDRARLGDNLMLIRTQVDAINASLDAYIDLANYNASALLLATTLGFPVLPDTADKSDWQSLAAALREHRIGAVPPATAEPPDSVTRFVDEVLPSLPVFDNLNAQLAKQCDI